VKELKPVEIKKQAPPSLKPILPPPKLNGKFKRDLEDEEDQKFMALISEENESNAQKSQLPPVANKA
jgi:hypothetical protein